MIFATVGTQLPFDRMIRALDEWAGATGRTDVFAQIGPTDYRPRHIKWSQFLDAQAFRRHVAEADVVVAHAGMGSIITALELGKPIIVMPRSAALGEHRNEHQAATAKHFLAQGRIAVAANESDLAAKLSNVNSIAAGRERLGASASERLLNAVRTFVEDGTLLVDSLGLPAIGTDRPQGAPRSRPVAPPEVATAQH